MIEQWNKEIILQRLLALTLLVAMFILCFKVIPFFIVPALWAAILAYVTFPVYTFFHTKVRLSPSFSAFLMTFSISLMIGIPLILGVFYLQHEVVSFVSMAIRRLQAGYLDLPEQIKNLPVIGQVIKDTLWEINKNPEA